MAEMILSLLESDLNTVMAIKKIKGKFKMYSEEYISNEYHKARSEWCKPKPLPVASVDREEEKRAKRKAKASMVYDIGFTRYQKLLDKRDKLIEKKNTIYDLKAIVNDDVKINTSTKNDLSDKAIDLVMLDVRIDEIEEKISKQREYVMNKAKSIKMPSGLYGFVYLVVEVGTPLHKVYSIPQASKNKYLKQLI